MTAEDLYKSAYFSSLEAGSNRSAVEIIPLILNLISCNSVIDVGCGTGVWLHEFINNGIYDVIGLDGDYVDKSLLQIPADQFIASNLLDPIKLDRKFDLVLCLEVAEHLPIESASHLVNYLVDLGPVVLFSAAIPYQVGTGHINGQWPDFWTHLFFQKRYITIDYIRPHIWQNESVEWWYAQNMLIFVEEHYLNSNPALKQEAVNNNFCQLSIVHPQNYLYTSRELLQLKEAYKPENISARFIINALPIVLTSSIRRWLARLRYKQ